MILLAAAAFLSPPGLIDDSDARRIPGLDPSPDCAEWTVARRGDRPRADVLEAWVTGVLSGYNLYHPKGAQDILRGGALRIAFEWIDRRCALDRRRNGTSEALPEVTMDLIGELENRPR